MCLRTLNFSLRLGFDLFCFIFAYNLSLLFIWRLISRVTQGWLSLGLQNLVGINFSVMLFRAFFEFCPFGVRIRSCDLAVVDILVVSHFFPGASPVCLLVQFNRPWFLLSSFEIDFQFMVNYVMITGA